MGDGPDWHISTSRAISLSWKVVCATLFAFGYASVLAHCPSPTDRANCYRSRVRTEADDIGIDRRDQSERPLRMADAEGPPRGQQDASDKAPRYGLFGMPFRCWPE
jgi:hypothetical protein